MKQRTGVCPGPKRLQNGLEGMCRRYAGVVLIAPPWAKPPEMGVGFVERQPIVDVPVKRSR